MLLNCKACDGPLKADDLDMKHGIATCRYCNAVMRFDALAASGGGGAAADANTIAERGEVGLPSGIAVENRGSDLQIVRRWFTPVAFFLVFFCIAWNSFLIFWYTMAIGVGAPWIFKVFPIVHVAVGVGLTYFTVACFVNTTVIAVQSGQLSVRHGPIPWPGNRTLDATQISQFYCKETVRHGENGSQTSYHLHAVTTDGRNLKLLSGLTTSEQAVSIEQQLEKHLGIEDRPVSGELPR